MRQLAYFAIFILAGCLFASAARGQVDPLSGGIGDGGKPASVQVSLNPPNPQPGNEGTLAITVDIKPGFHAQSHTPLDPNLIPLEVTMSPAAGVELRPPIYPPGMEEEYPALGKLSVYSGQVVINVPFRVKPDAPKAPLALQGKVTYQICDDKSCYPPETTAFSTTSGAASAPTPPEEKISVGLFGLELGHDSYLLAFAIALAVGIIFNLMPCVLPVVPLKIIGFYEVSQHQRGKCFLLGMVFSLGVVATFAFLAILLLIAHSVAAWGELFSNPYFLGGLIIVLVAMALSMFGVFTVVVPTGLYSYTPRHDTYLGNFLFGILTATLSTPCTAPMFVPLLTWAGAQPALLGLVVVMTVGAGMALPYLVLSAFPEAARRFPRTGPWPEVIKQVMGILMVGVAFFFAGGFLEDRIGPRAFWWTIFAFVAAAAVFLMIRAVQFSASTRARLVAGGVALLMVVPALGFVIRQVAGSPIYWKPYTPATLAAAQASGHPVFLEFTATWCGNCRYLEATVFRDPAVVQAIQEKKVIAIRANVTSYTRNAADWKLLNSINPGGVGAVPLTVIYSPRLKQPIQISGVYTTGHLLSALAQAAGEGK